MNRIAFISELFRTRGYRTYLEIGTEHGRSLFPIPARSKIAVDPAFRIPWRRRLRWILRYPPNARIAYVAKESARFFREDQALLARRGPIDVCLVDGLHTFRAALQDVFDALAILSDDGWVVMHDCLPPHAAAAFPSSGYPTPLQGSAIPGWSGEWCGDVWKAIVYLRRHHADTLDVRVADCDYGLGLVRFRRPVGTRTFEIDPTHFDAVDALSYEALRAHAVDWMGIVPPSALAAEIAA